MKRLTHDVGAANTNILVFPSDWDALPFAEHTAAVVRDDELRIESTMRTAMRVKYIHDTFFVEPEIRKRPARYAEASYESFEEWCESIDRTEQWGQWMIGAAPHAGRVANPSQAHELTGLSDEEADAVVEDAKNDAEATGKPVTAGSIATARQRREAVVSQNAREFKAIEASERIDACRRKCQQIRKIAGPLEPDERAAVVAEVLSITEELVTDCPTILKPLKRCLEAARAMGAVEAA